MAIDIYNDAWSDNWGSVPITRAEARKLAADFKLFLVPEITRLVDIDGEPAAFAIAIPNLNELIDDLHGKLFPLGLAKLLWRLKVKGAASGRMMLLGIVSGSTGTSASTRRSPRSPTPSSTKPAARSA